MSKVLVIQHSDLAGPDNPKARWDFGFHYVKLAGRRAIANLEDKSDTFTEADLLAAAQTDRQRSEIEIEIRRAVSQDDILKVLHKFMGFIGVTKPTEKLNAGLKVLAKRIALERALKMTQTALDILKVAKQLRNGEPENEEFEYKSWAQAQKDRQDQEAQT